MLERAAIASSLGIFGTATAARALNGGSSLSEMSATEVVDHLRRGDFLAEAYAHSVLTRCEARKDLNAFISLDAAQVLESARQADRLRRSGRPLGMLHGLPLPVKDSINTRQLPTTAGTGALRTFRPREDAPIIRQLINQGAVLLGKTNLQELSLGWTSNNKIYGAVHNPYDFARVPGGSSGGSAAAVAARIVPLAVGEDTLGSIRVPASICGVCGLRPTVGRYPSDGIMPITPRWDAPGPLARNVADLILFDAAMQGRTTPIHATPLKGVRIAVPPEYLVGVSSEVEQIIGVALQKLSDAGVVLVHAALPEDLKNDLTLVRAIQSFELVANQMHYLEQSGRVMRFEELFAGMSPDLQKRYQTDFLPGGANAITRETRDELLGQLSALRRALSTYYADNQVAAIAYPPTLTAALPIGEDRETEIRGERVPLFKVMARNVAHGSAAGMPCLVITAGMTTGNLPVGIGFDMLPGKDEELLSLGLSLEQVLGQAPPPPG